uniref:Uncharacterized protein n=1 Tax=Setaria viridis TaxID=4556 RepID=A0A4U6W0Y2_SETVI|nr:hypothetical protein SEVIR_2G357000v2 [Setaria viridis]
MNPATGPSEQVTPTCQAHASLARQGRQEAGLLLGWLFPWWQRRQRLRPQQVGRWFRQLNLPTRWELLLTRQLRVWRRIVQNYQLSPRQFRVVQRKIQSPLAPKPVKTKWVAPAPCGGGCTQAENPEGDHVEGSLQQVVLGWRKSEEWQPAPSPGFLVEVEVG